MTNVVNATKEDIKEWVKLAFEVEYLFGPMVDDPSFIKALEKKSIKVLRFVYERIMVCQGQIYLVECYFLQQMHQAIKLGGYQFHPNRGEREWQRYCLITS